MGAPHNRARGEVAIEIDGRAVRLCLTLGALAELESAFDVASFAELGERLKHLAAHDLIVVLSALVTGGGESLSARDLACAAINPNTAARAVADCFRVALDE